MKQSKYTIFINGTSNHSDIYLKHIETALAIIYLIQNSPSRSDMYSTCCKWISSSLTNTSCNSKTCLSSTNLALSNPLRRHWDSLRLCSRLEYRCNRQRCHWAQSHPKQALMNYLFTKTKHKCQRQKISIVNSPAVDQSATSCTWRFPPIHP